jgi:hypothetical protein
MIDDEIADISGEMVPRRGPQEFNAYRHLA